MKAQDLKVGQQCEWQVKENKWRLVRVKYVSDWSIVIQFITGEADEPELPLSIINEPDRVIFRELDIEREMGIRKIMSALKHFGTDLDYTHVGCMRDVAAHVYDAGHSVNG